MNFLSKLSKNKILTFNNNKKIIKKENIILLLLHLLLKVLEFFQINIQYEFDLFLSNI